MSTRRLQELWELLEALLVIGSKKLSDHPSRTATRVERDWRGPDSLVGRTHGRPRAREALPPPRRARSCVPSGASSKRRGEEKAETNESESGSNGPRSICLRHGDVCARRDDAGELEPAAAGAAEELVLGLGGLAQPVDLDEAERRR